MSKVRLLLCLLIFAGTLCAQNSRDSITRFKNRRIQRSIQYIDNETLVVQNFYKSGRLKDSISYKIETFIAVKNDPDKNKGYADTIYDIKNVEFGTGKRF